MNRAAQGRSAAGMGARWERIFDLEMKVAGAISIPQHPASTFSKVGGRVVGRVTGRAHVDRIVLYTGYAFAIELKSSMAKGSFSPNKKGGRFGGPETQFMNLVDAHAAGCAAGYCVYWAHHQLVEFFYVDGHSRWPIRLALGTGAWSSPGTQQWGPSLLEKLSRLRGI